ncbi:MAG TPA: histidine phosphatase family protein [Verrucomicrobiae bacterium]|nr:histidine phosphatase family protein [Verrucomicrobiae bacterium]
MREFSLEAGAVELLLLRHAEATPDPNADVVHASYRDLPLNARGHAQARALALRCASMKIATIYASPLRRAAETAKAISLTTERAIAYDERLREVEIGGLDEPRHPAEFGAHLDRLAELAIAHGGWSQIPGTEGSRAIRERMRAAIDAIVAEHAGARVAVVSHAGSINAYLADVIGLASDFFFPAANASISVVRANGPKRLLVALNDVAHLHKPRARLRHAGS